MCRSHSCFIYDFSNINWTDMLAGDACFTVWVHIGVMIITRLMYCISFPALASSCPWGSVWVACKQMMALILWKYECVSPRSSDELVFICELLHNGIGGWGMTVVGGQNVSRARQAALVSSVCALDGWSSVHDDDWNIQQKCVYIERYRFECCKTPQAGSFRIHITTTSTYKLNTKHTLFVEIYNTQKDDVGNDDLESNGFCFLWPIACSLRTNIRVNVFGLTDFESMVWK